MAGDHASHHLVASRRMFTLIELQILTDKTSPQPYVAILQHQLPLEVIPLQDAKPGRLKADGILVDVDLQDSAKIRAVRSLLTPKPSGLLMFLIDDGSRAQDVQSRSLGAENVFSRPLDCAQVPMALARRRDLPARLKNDPPKTAEEIRVEKSNANAAIAADAIQASFTSLMSNSGFKAEAFVRLSGAVVDDIDAIGVDRWLSEVRKHHSSTYQHCLTVTGLTSAFGRALGLGKETTRRLALAGLVHDIGKARISLEILDKPGKLSDAEFAVMRQHPVRGYDFLKANSDLDEQIVGMTRSHHEYLDGSGYPDGLRGPQIDDLTRIVTICDVYSALIEQRSYKLPMKAEAAYAILQAMVDEGRLDMALVRAFKDVAFSIDAQMKFAPRRSARFG